MTGMRPWDVFISHAGENKPFAEALCDLLGRMGLLAFVDKVALKPGMSADQVMRDAAARARIGVVVLDRYYLNKTWPMEELRIIMQRRTCLPVLLGLSYGQLQEEVARQQQQPTSCPEDSAMLDILRRISMVTAAVDAYKLLQHAAFAVVQLLVKKDCRQLRSYAADLALLLRVQIAAQHILKPGEFSALNKADAESAQEWALWLRFRCKELALAGPDAAEPLLPSELPAELQPPPRNPCYRHQGSDDQSSSDLLSDVLTALSGTKMARVLLWGMVGIGKTAMACHIANLPLDPAAPQAWQGVLWTTWGLESRGEDALLRAVRKLLCQLNLRTAAAAGMTTIEDAQAALHDWLRGRQMLLVMDDVWDQGIPRLFQAANCQLLVTAEQRSMGPLDWSAVNLTPQMVHDSGVAGAIVDAHNMSSMEMDVVALAEECAFHPGMMLATTRALNALGGSIRNAVLICLEEDEEQYVQRAHRSISLQPAAPVELLGTMSLLPGGGFTPTAVVSRIHKRQLGMVRRVGQQLVQSSLLFEGQDFPRFNQLWMHPIVSAATSALQQPRLDQLLQDGQTDALGLLLWYGADSFGPMETATHRPLSVCEAAAATVLPMEGQRQFVSSVRQAMRSSSHLAALWHQCPEQATLLLRSLATLDAVAVSRVSYGLLQRDRGQLQQVTLPTRQAAYASVLRPLCEADSPPSPPLNAVVCERAVEVLLELVRDGLDLSLPWLHAGVAAGADVLRLLLHRMQLGSSPASPLSAALEADLAPRKSGASVRSCGSSSPSSWCAVSMPMKSRAPFMLPAARGAAAAAAAAATAVVAAARAAAAKRMVEQEGLLSDLMRLASLKDSRAQLAGLSCLAMLACSPTSAEAILNHDSTGADLARCLTSGPIPVKEACLRAAEAIVQHSPQTKQGLGAKSSFMTALAGATQACPQAKDLYAKLAAGVDNVSPGSASLDITLSQRVADVKQHLADLADSGSAVLGLHGMAGVGKTVLARAVFEELRSQFVGCSCFVEVGSLAHEAPLVQLQGAMLRELCDTDRHVSNVGAGRAELASRLYDARVLLVLDNICTCAQLDALLVTVGQGSCVLVTAQDADLLRRPGIHTLQSVDPLSQAEAMELFLQRAQPPPECSDLAASMVEACAGLPLALTVVGNSLRGQQGRGEWEQALHRLRAAEGLPGGADDPLVGRLRLSYDALGTAEQEMFLDIACFMLGKDARACAPAWGSLADSTLSNLESRSLVGVGRDGRLTMHDVLCGMGRAIVVEEHSQPARRSRLWMPDSGQAFNSLQGSNTLQTLSFVGAGQLLGTRLPRMPELRLLNVDTAKWNASFSVFSAASLVYLEWHAAELVPGLPSTLAVLDLSGSSSMAVLTDTISRLKQLITLDLHGCRSLAELPEGISALSMLRLLDLEGCSSLTNLSAGFSRLGRLQALDLGNCRNFYALPEDMSGLSSLQSLDLHGGNFTALPEGISALSSLQSLDLNFCMNLAALPEGMSGLGSLQSLDLNGCISLAALPEGMSGLGSLQSLDLHFCMNLAALPEGVSGLSSLQSLDLHLCDSLVVLPDSISALSSLQSLDLNGAEDLVALPLSISGLSSLHSLNLNGCIRLFNLPDSISALSSLQSLDLHGCRSLVALPEGVSALSSLQSLDLQGCANLAPLSPSVELFVAKFV